MPAEPRNPARCAARLEELLSADAPVAKFSELGNPEYLDLLFHIVLCKLVRLGPDTCTGTVLSPAVLIGRAEREARAGQLPMETPADLRANLVTLGDELKKSGKWLAKAPLPWEPLPAPGPNEQRWLRLRNSNICNLELTSAFAANAERFQVVPDFLPGPLLPKLAVELDHIYAKGILNFKRAGVGQADQLDKKRTDRVCYLSGLEPGLIQSAPNLVGLVRYLLNHGAATLVTSSPQQRLFAPLSAMLARYESPSEGYHPHMDNPGGEADNGRTRTLTMYLSNPDKTRQGGDLAVWLNDTRTDQEPYRVIPPTPGSAVVMDSRAIPHQVTPLRTGPPRWALTLWFNDAPQTCSLSQPRPKPEHVLLANPNPPLPPGRLLFHELDDHTSHGTITLHIPTRRPRLGLVSTVYRAGAYLETWCEHHFAAGIDRLILVFDHLDEPQEAHCAQLLATRFPNSQLDIRGGAQMNRKEWPDLPEDPRLEQCRLFAAFGSSSQAVAARQMLNASAVLQSAKGTLDWLIHLDGDELLVPAGPGRGGACLPDCFAAADSSGYQLLRFVNHEFLRAGDVSSPRFKRNPRMGAALLGPMGWQAMVKQLGLAQDGPRPWFTGYFNGKSAVSVAAGTLAAGVHGWYLNQPANARNSAFLAGPHVLHCHLSTPQSFRQKFLAIADSTVQPGRLFAPSPVEEAALILIKRSRAAGLSAQELNQALENFHHELTFFSEGELSLLEQARLLMSFDQPNIGTMIRAMKGTPAA